MLASDFELVKDINSVPSGASSGPGEIVQVGAITFFAASTSSFGRELWKSDGTAAGTVLVKDISDGRASSSPATLTDVNGTLYFNANDDYYNGFELWKSDGTETGTVLVSHIIAGNRDY